MKLTQAQIAAREEESRIENLRRARRLNNDGHDRNRAYNVTHTTPIPVFIQLIQP